MTEFGSFNIHEIEPIPDYFKYAENHESNNQQLIRKRSDDNEDESVYLKGTLEYKKARKKRQNRESATRSRARKKIEVGNLDLSLNNLLDVNQTLQIENAALKAENEMLKKEIEFYRGIADENTSKLKGKKTSPR